MADRVSTNTGAEQAALNAVEFSPQQGAFQHALRRCDQRLVIPALEFSREVAALRVDPNYGGVKPRALAVGGFVRDAITGLNPKDLDLEVYGVAPARLQELVERVFDGRVNSVGQSFGVLKAHLGGGLELDISIPRRESKIGQGHKGFAVEGDPALPIEEAARRRDFTINALAADLLSGDEFDYFGGRADLNDGIIRVTDPERFQDDPLRVYRGVQFAARFQFQIDKPTFQLMSLMVERGVLGELARERVREELCKLILKSERPSLGFELLRDLGITRRYFPELQALAESAVWARSLTAADEAARIFRESPQRLCGVLAALMCGFAHTEGAPLDRAEHARQFLRRLAFPNQVEHAIIPCIVNQGAPEALARHFESTHLHEREQINAARCLLKSLRPAGWDLFIGVSEAEYRAREAGAWPTLAYRAGERLNEIIKQNNLDGVPHADLLRGRDLLDLGCVPGKEVGRIIAAIEELRDRGLIENREQALQHARVLRGAAR